MTDFSKLKMLISSEIFIAYNNDPANINALAERTDVDLSFAYSKDFKAMIMTAVGPNKGSLLMFGKRFLRGLMDHHAVGEPDFDDHVDDDNDDDAGPRPTDDDVDSADFYGDEGYNGDDFLRGIDLGLFE